MLELFYITQIWLCHQMYTKEAAASGYSPPISIIPVFSSTSQSPFWMYKNLSPYFSKHMSTWELHISIEVSFALPSVKRTAALNIYHSIFQLFPQSAAFQSHLLSAPKHPAHLYSNKLGKSSNS